MDRLPEELIALICEHCDHASLKNARLVSKSFNACSTPAVFEHMYMGLFRHSLANLEQLANSHLANHVLTFTIYCDILPNWSRSTWLKAIDFRPPFKEFLTTYKTQRLKKMLGRASHFGNTDHLTDEYNALPRHHFTEEELDAGYTRYVDCTRQQSDCCLHTAELRFKEFFSRLPNLQTAEAVCTTPFSGRTNARPVWKALREKIYVGPDDWMYSTDFHDYSYASKSGQAALSLLEGVAYRASFAGTKHVTKLKLHSAHIGSYRSLLHGSDAPDERFNRLFQGFHHLATLHIHIPHATISARLMGSELAAETMDFLRSATRLRELNLRYGDDELSPDDDVSQLERLFMSESTIWPDLEVLALATNVSADTLLSFLHNHSSMLRSLELRDMLIHDVDHAVKEIPRILKLEHVYMECLWDDAEHVGETRVTYLSVLSNGTDFDAPYEKSVKAYLLGQADTLPALERDGGLGNPEGYDDDQDMNDEDDSSSEEEG